MIQTSDMSSLSLLRGADAAILGSRGSAGAIVITLKDGKDIPARPAQGIITCTPLGYSDSVEFYHPTYDTPEKKNDQRSDLRSTIYWNPTLQLDANGKATIEYYTPDSTAPEDITIEGVDKNGKVCRIVQTINNKINVVKDFECQVYRLTQVSTTLLRHLYLYSIKQVYIC